MSQQMSCLFFVFCAGLGKCQHAVAVNGSSGSGWALKKPVSDRDIFHLMCTTLTLLAYLFSLFTPCHLSVSIWNTAVFPLQLQHHPPFSLGLHNCTRRLLPYSTVLLIINNFGFFCKSLLHSPFTLCHATLSSILFNSASGMSFTCSTPIPCQLNSLQQLIIIFNQLPLPYFTASRPILLLKSLSSYIYLMWQHLEPKKSTAYPHQSHHWQIFHFP